MARTELALAALLALGAARTARAQTPSEAATAFREAEHAFLRGDLERALDLYRRSYELQPDVDVLFNLAVTEGNLGLYVDAYRDLSRYIRAVPDPGSSRRAEVERALQFSRERIALLTVRVSLDGAVVRVDGNRVGTSPLADPIPLAPGEHLLEVTAEDGRVQTERFTAVAAGTRDVSVQLDEPSRVILDVLPVGAAVRIDGALAGVAPLREPVSLAAGDHTLEVTVVNHVPQRRILHLLPGAETRERVRLAPLPATLTVVGAPRGAMMRVGERSVALPWHGAVPPGERRAVVWADGHRGASHLLLLRPGEARTLRVHLEPAPPFRPVWFWSAVGVTGIAAASAAVLGTLAVIGDADYRSNPLRTREDHDDGVALAQWTDASIVAALCAAGVAALLHVWTDFGAEPAEVAVQTGLATSGQAR